MRGVGGGGGGGSGGETVTVDALDVCWSADAVTFAVPTATAVTTPLWLTDATDGALDDQLSDEVASLGLTDAESWVDAPTMSPTDEGLKLMPRTGTTTVTDAE